LSSKNKKYVLQCEKEAKLAICVQCTNDSEQEMWESYRLPKTLIKFLLIHNCLMQWLWYSRSWLWTEYGYVIKTNFREQSPSSQANSCSVPQEILCFSGNQNLHYHVHNAHNLSLYWTRWIQFTPSHHTFL